MINTNILSECLLESTLLEIKKIEETDYSHINASEEFKKRIQATIDGAKAKSKKKQSRKITLIVIAAIFACMLIVFSASAEIRNNIARFFAEFGDGFVDFFVPNEEAEDYPKTIETEYSSNFFEENGYELYERNESSLHVTKRFQKDGCNISLYQQVVTENCGTLDTNDSSYTIKIIGNFEVHYTLKHNTYSAKWIAYDYDFSMTCYGNVSFESVEQIILSLEPVT